MKKLLISFVLGLFLAPLCVAQDYLVYTVKGDVSVNNGGKTETVTRGMGLARSSVLTLSEGAKLVILSESENKLYSVKDVTGGKLSDLVKKDAGSAQQLTESYLAYIKKKITDSGDPKDKDYKQAAGTSYRETDSLLVDVIAPQELSRDTLTVK